MKEWRRDDVVEKEGDWRSGGSGGGGVKAWSEGDEGIEGWTGLESGGGRNEGVGGGVEWRRVGEGVKEKESRSEVVQDQGVNDSKTEQASHRYDNINKIKREINNDKHNKSPIQNKPHQIH